MDLAMTRPDHRALSDAQVAVLDSALEIAWHRLQSIEINKGRTAKAQRSGI